MLTRFVLVMDLLIFGFLLALSIAFLGIGFLFKNRLFVLSGGVIMVLVGFFTNGASVAALVPVNETTVYTPDYFVFADDNTTCVCCNFTPDASPEPVACEVSEYPVCGGYCEQGFECSAGVGKCECVQEVVLCADSFPACDGYCGEGVCMLNVLEDGCECGQA